MANYLYLDNLRRITIKKSYRDFVCDHCGDSKDIASKCIAVIDKQLYLTVKAEVEAEYFGGNTDSSTFWNMLEAQVLEQGKECYCSEKCFNEQYGAN
jgi:hypothetical protein